MYGEFTSKNLCRAPNLSLGSEAIRKNKMAVA